MKWRWETGGCVLDMIGDGISLEKSLKEKRKADDLIYAAVSMKSGIDTDVLKRIVETLENQDDE